MAEDPVPGQAASGHEAPSPPQGGPSDAAKLPAVVFQHPAASATGTGSDAEPETARGETRPDGAEDAGRSERRGSQAATDTAAVPGPVRGAFLLEEPPNGPPDDFDLRPDPDRPFAIPEDQRRISGGVYAVRNTLKLLKQHQIFGTTDADYEEFVARVKQAAKAGCVGTNVDPALAAAALEAIRADIMRRRGRPVAFRYLLRLAVWALVGLALGLAIVAVATLANGAAGFGWLVIGAMVGAWLSVAASRWEIAFDGIPEFLDLRYEPPVRMLFVALLAVVVGVFLQQGVLSFSLGSVNLATFSQAPQTALTVGIVAGIGERALSVQLLGRAKQVFTTASS